MRLTIFAALILAILTGCGAKENSSPETKGNKPTRKLVVYSPHGQEMMDEYIKAFEEAHPGIDAVGRFVPPGQILSQLRIDKAKPQVDVWWGGTSAFFTQAKAEGLLAPYKPSWAASSKPGYHDAQDMWYAQFLQVPAFMFSSKIYKPEELPAKWTGLLDEKWKNKIVIREPLDSGTMKTIFSGIIWGLGGAALDPASGYDFLKRLDAQTRTYLPNPQALYDRIAKSPEGYISLWNLTDIIYQSQVNKYPFGYRIPEEPVPVSLDPIGLIAGSPNAEEAKLFYEFVTSKENCLKMARDHFRILARTDIADAELPPQLASAHFSPLDLDLVRFDQLQAEWMDHWRGSIRDPGK